VARNLLNTAPVCANRFVHPPQGKHAVAHLHEALGFPVRPSGRRSGTSPPEKSDGDLDTPRSGGPRNASHLRSSRGSLRSCAGNRAGRRCNPGRLMNFLRDSPNGELTGGPHTYLAENRPLASCASNWAEPGCSLDDSGISHLAASLGVPFCCFLHIERPIQWSRGFRQFS